MRYSRLKFDERDPWSAPPPGSVNGLSHPKGTGFAAPRSNCLAQSRVSRRSRCRSRPGCIAPTKRAPQGGGGREDGGNGATGNSSSGDDSRDIAKPEGPYEPVTVTSLPAEAPAYAPWSRHRNFCCPVGAFGYGRTVNSMAKVALAPTWSRPTGLQLSTY